MSHGETLESPITAYRMDVAGCGAEGFGDDDGAWIAIGASMARAARDNPAVAKRSFLDACRLGKSLRDRGTIITGPVLDAQTSRASRIDHGAYVLRSVAEAVEEAGALRLAKCILDGLTNSAPTMSALERGRTIAQRARVLWKLGANSLAESDYKRVGRMGRAKRIRELEARGWLGRATLAQIRGNYPAMRRYAQRTLRTAEAYGLDRLACAAHRGLTAAAAGAGDFDLALIHGWRAYTLANKEGIDELPALQNLSQILLDAGHRVEARAGFRAILGARPSARVALGAIGGFALASALLHAEDDVQWAVRELAKLAQRCSPPYQSAAALEECSRALSLIGRTTQANRLGRQARSIARPRDYHELTYRIDSTLTSVPPMRSQPVHLSAPAAAVVHNVSRLRPRGRPLRVNVVA